MVLFAPLYASNECSNNCLYCAFRRDNRELAPPYPDHGRDRARDARARGDGAQADPPAHGGERKAGRGVCDGGDAHDLRDARGPRRDPPREREHGAADGRGVPRIEGRRASAPISVSRRPTIPSSIATCIPPARRRTTSWRLGVFDRCFAAGIDDVGMGVLFGLYDFRFEVLALLAPCRASRSHLRRGAAHHFLPAHRARAERARGREHPLPGHAMTTCC